MLAGRAHDLLAAQRGLAPLLRAARARARALVRREGGGRGQVAGAEAQRADGLQAARRCLGSGVRPHIVYSCSASPWRNNEAAWVLTGCEYVAGPSSTAAHARKVRHTHTDA